MPLQRVCDAEKQARNTGSNGPRRVQGNGESGVFCNALGCVSSRGYVGILQSGIARGLYTASPAMKQGGTADNRFIRPWQRTFSLLRTFLREWTRGREERFFTSLFTGKPQETAGEVAEKGTGTSRETAGEIASCNRAGVTKEEQQWNSTKWIS